MLHPCVRFYWLFKRRWRRISPREEKTSAEKANHLPGSAYAKQLFTLATPAPHKNTSMKISSKLTLAVIGLIAFAGTPTTVYAQQDKGGVNEATDRQQGEAGSVEKTHESNKGQKAGKKKKKPQSKAGKVGAKNKEVVKAVAQEMNRYTNQLARLKKGREVAAAKNDTAMKKKVKDLEPKVEAKHTEEMAKLRKRYGDKEVNEALEVVERERKRGKDGKANRAGTKKKKQQNKRNNQKNNSGGSGESSS